LEHGGRGWSRCAVDAVAKASAINPGYAFGYLVKAVVAMQMRQVPEGFEAAQMAIALDPNLASGYAVLGFAERGLGRCESSIEHVKQAFALSPHDPTIGVWHMWLGYSELCRGRLDAAIEEFKRSIDAGYRIVYTYGLLAAALALKGDDAEARVALTEARRLAPELTVKWFMTRGPELPIAAEGLRKAGLPEE
jgi:tetratricopeptide (TPR) repeat protein